MNTQFQDLVNNIHTQDCSHDDNKDLRKILLLCFRLKNNQFTREQRLTILNIMEQLNDFAAQYSEQRENQQRKIERCTEY
jgi:hypothetical protein